MKYRISVDVDVDKKSWFREGDGVKAILLKGKGGLYLLDKSLEAVEIDKDPFTSEEMGTILELARVALGDAEVYDYFAEKLDLSDKEMKSLQKKIEEKTS